MNNSDSIVIIPTYNEKENIEKIIRAVFALEKCFHILVIDDGSPDGTAQIVKSLMATEFADRLFILERSGKLGLGTAYIAGFKWALERDYEYVFEMDADFSHDPADLPRLYGACHDEGYDVSVGSRYVSGVNVVNWPMGRILMSYYASKYVRMVTGINVRDTTAGFVCYRRRVLQTIELDKIRFKGYAFQIEMKYTATKIGFKIKEVPVVFVNRREGTSKMSGGIFSEAFFGVMRLRWDGWTRRYPALPLLLAVLLSMALPQSADGQNIPKVTTDTRYARGATMAFGRVKKVTISGTTVTERGMCWATHPEPTYDEHHTTNDDRLNNNGFIYWLRDLEPATLYYMRAYAKTKEGDIGYGDDIKFYTLPKGQISFTMRDGGDQATYDRIKNATQTAIDWWNNLTEMKDFHPNVGYASGTPTADCSYGGWIRVGPNTSYQRPGTIMHEMLHGCGVIPWADTEWSRHNLRSSVNGDGYGTGYWLGDRVTEVLRFWDNSTSAQLNGDYQHMWPYGINGANEDNGTDLLYIGNGLICQALGEDGLQHTNNHFAEPYYALMQEDTTKFYIKNEDPDRGFYTSYLTPDTGGRLKWTELSAAQATANDSAAWYFTFTPDNQYYQVRNAATGQYLTYSGNTFRTVARATATANEDFHLMKGRVDVPLGSSATRGYWIIHPTSNWTPPCLTANANGNTAGSTFNIANSATKQRWLILTSSETAALEEAAVGQLKQLTADVMKPIKALADVPCTEDGEPSRQAFIATLSSIEQRAGEATSYIEVAPLADEARKAALDYLSVATPADLSKPFDLTYLMPNSDMASTDGWSQAPGIAYGCGEFYQKTFNTYQTVSLLPKGTYRFLVNAFQRPGMPTDSYNSYMAGEDLVTTRFYVDDEETKVRHIASEVQTRRQGGSESTVGGKYFMPNDMQSASKYFAKGFYENVLTLASGGADVKVGLRGGSTASYDWSIFGNFRIYFYGAASIDDLTAIATPATPVTGQPTTVYSLDGRRMQVARGSLQPGIYIIDGRKTVVR